MQEYAKSETLWLNKGLKYEIKCLSWYRKSLLLYFGHHGTGTYPKRIWNLFNGCKSIRTHGTTVF